MHLHFKEMEIISRLRGLQLNSIAIGGKQTREKEQYWRFKISENLRSMEELRKMPIIFIKIHFDKEENREM